ncbi:hypothetical protein MAR_024099, partial [Mya arenaria]
MENPITISTDRGSQEEVACTTYTYLCPRKGEIWAREETRPPQKATPNRRLCEIKKIRAELRSLRKRYRCSSDAEKEGIVQLREQLRARLKALTNAERLRCKREAIFQKLHH